VDLFNALALEPDVDLQVFYLRKMTPGRQWTELRKVEHRHEFIREIRWHRHFYLNPGLTAAVDRFSPDVLIITQYASLGMQWLMYRSAIKGQTWVYWSETPGVKFSELPIFGSNTLRLLARRLALLPLRIARPRAVWGIGRRAVEAYTCVSAVPCENVPYYSDQSEFRAIKRGMPNSPLRFLYAGKLNHRKGFDLLVQAVERLSSLRSDFQAVVIGDGPERELLEHYDERTRARFSFRGFRELAEVPGEFAAADVLIYPSRYDGWGMGVVEGMASAMPVIASRGATSACELLSHEKTGLLFDPGDVDALAGCMLRFLDHPEDVLEMGERARQAAAALSASEGASAIAQRARGIMGL
jgi:glycosyltransferase involved in cell wall biosynthesis